jgi:protein SCO1/2
MMHHLAVNRLVRLCGATLLIAAICLGQAAPAKKAYTFHGKVEAVNTGANSLTVNGEKVEGWMDAMTMGYKVDDPAVLKNVKPGDRITATVYEGDMTLHKVQVMPKASGDSKSKN